MHSQTVEMPGLSYLGICVTVLELLLLDYEI